MKKTVFFIGIILFASSLLAQVKTKTESKRSGSAKQVAKKSTNKGHSTKKNIPPVVLDESADLAASNEYNLPSVKSTSQDDKSVVSAGSEINETPVMIEYPAEKPDVQAKFPLNNGDYLNYFKDNFEYPTRCLEDGLSGKVVLRFVVDVKGRIRNISCVEETKSCPEFTKEAIRVLMKSPNWTPALINGRYVNSWMQIPVNFVLN